MIEMVPLQLGNIEGYLVTVLVWIGIYGLLALGLNLQWGQTGLFNIGIIGFAAVGAYTSAILTMPPDAAYLGGFGFPFPVGLIGGMIAAGFIGFLIGIPTLRLREDYLAIVTLGFSEIIRLIFLNEEWIARGPKGVFPEAPIRDLWRETVPLVNYNWFWVALLIVSIVLVYVALERINDSPFGRVLKSIREDEQVSMAVGKNVYWFKMRSFVVGCMIMGAAGSFQAHYIGYLNPDFFWPLITFYVWMALLLGGTGNNKGALLGAAVLMIFLEGSEFVTGVIPAAVSPTQIDSIRFMFVGLLLILLMQYRPEGVLPERLNRFDFSDGGRSS